MSVALHPESVPGDPAAIRWVIPPGTLPVRGGVAQAPGEFGALLDAGIISAGVDADAVLVRVLDGTWRELGPRVRTALGDALASPQAWAGVGDRPAVVGPDAALTEAAEHVLAGEAGDYVRSHGGRIELVRAGGGCVEVRLTGACGHCPAAAATLHHRVETALRAAYPDLVELRQVS